MARNIAWGIDVGESAIKAVQLRRSGDSVIIQQWHTLPCEARPEEAQGSDKESRVRAALASLQGEVILKKGTLVVSISGQDVFPRFLPLPPVEKKKIPEVVRYEARTSMPFPIEEVIWDYQPLEEHPEPGEEVEVALFAIKRATVYGFLSNLRLAGLVPHTLEIAPLALYNFLVYDRDMDVGTVVIDVGAGNTDLVIIDGERFWTRNVAVSGNDITRALQEKYQISFEEAEDLKKKAAGSKQADKLFEVMRPIVDDLLGEVQRSIGYYKAQTQSVRIERVLLLGNAFKLPQLVDYFRENLDYEVGVTGPLERLRVAGTDPASFAAEVPNYGVAIGLALQGLGLARVNIDLMPADVVRERVLKQKVPYAAVAVGLLALPILLGFQSAAQDQARYRREIEPVRQDIRRYEALEQKEKEAANLEPMAGQLEQIAGIGQGRRDWPRYLDSLNQALSQIPRNRFLVRRIAHLREEGRGRPTAAPAARKPKEEAKEETRAVKLLLAFESEQRFTDADAQELEGYLRQPAHVRDVEFRERTVTQRTLPRGAASRGTLAVSDARTTVWVSSFVVTFSMEPLTESEAAPSPAAK